MDLQNDFLLFVEINKIDCNFWKKNVLQKKKKEKDLWQYKVNNETLTF